MKVSISFLKSNYNLPETISKINNIKYDGFIHVDILDGEYVDAKKTDFDNYLEVLKDAKKPLDVHLMVNHPSTYIEKLLPLKPQIITVHPDCLENIVNIHDILKSNDIKMGLALNPDDDIYIIKEYIKYVDLVLIMSVFPGKGGQPFLANTPYKLLHLKEQKDVFKKEFLIEVDGGINKDTINYVKDIVDIVVSGSYICCSNNYEERVKILEQ